MQNQHHGLSQFVTQAPHELHHAGRVIHVEVICGFIEKHVVRILREHHGNKGPLALAARHFVDKTVSEIPQFHIVDRPRHDRPIIRREMRTGVGKPPERDEFFDRDFHLRRVGLRQNRHALS